MKKQINATGVNGTFTGWVEVKYNIVATMHMYDENYEVLLRKGEIYHYVVGAVNERVFEDSICTGESSLWEAVNDMVGKVGSELEILANLNTILHIESQLKAKGFV